MHLHFFTLSLVLSRSLNESVRVHDCEGGARRDLAQVLADLQPTTANGPNNTVRVKLAGMSHYWF